MRASRRGELAGEECLCLLSYLRSPGCCESRRPHICTMHLLIEVVALFSAGISLAPSWPRIAQDVRQPSLLSQIQLWNSNLHHFAPHSSISERSPRENDHDDHSHLRDRKTYHQHGTPHSDSLHIRRIRSCANVHGGHKLHSICPCEASDHL